MHINDIPRIIASGDVGEIERAFCTLTGYPFEGEVRGANAKNMLAALDAVSTALLQDLNIMPLHICEAARLPAGTTYREGARDFKAHQAWWQGRLNALCGVH